MAGYDFQIQKTSKAKRNLDFVYDIEPKRTKQTDSSEGISKNNAQIDKTGKLSHDDSNHGKT